MAQRYFTGKGDVKAIAKMISGEMQSAGITNQLVGSTLRETDGVTIILLVFERYYMRASNRASLSVLLTGDSAGGITVDAIGAGGGQGALMSFSWGAEEDFVSILQNILTRHGFY